MFTIEAWVLIWYHNDHMESKKPKVQCGYTSHGGGGRVPHLYTYIFSAEKSIMKHNRSKIAPVFVCNLHTNLVRLWG